MPSLSSTVLPAGAAGEPRLPGLARATGRAERVVRVLLVGSHEPDLGRLIGPVEADGDIEVAGLATFGDALEAVSRAAADVVVITLCADTLPAANTLVVATIKRLMERNPTPILAIQPRGGCLGATRMATLVAGAVEVLSHPADREGSPATLRTSLRNLDTLSLRQAVQAPPGPELGQTSLPVLGLGASAGGPEALATILSGLSGLASPVIVSQHLDVRSMGPFLDHLRSRSALPVVAVTNGASLDPRTVYVAPPENELRVATGRRLEVLPEQRTGSWPMIDSMFASLADKVGRSAIGVVLTGMGADGASGLLRIREAGGLTIAQDAETSDIYGMPRVARDSGAARHVLALSEIAPAIVAAANSLANRPYRTPVMWSATL